jgi:hypothetical protein
VRADGVVIAALRMVRPITGWAWNCFDDLQLQRSRSPAGADRVYCEPHVDWLRHLCRSQSTRATF